MSWVAENCKYSSNIIIIIIIITIFRYLHVLVNVWIKIKQFRISVILVRSHLRTENYFVQLAWPRPATGGRQREMNVGWREWFWGEKHDSCWEGRARRWEGILWFLTTGLKLHNLSSGSHVVFFGYFTVLDFTACLHWVAYKSIISAPAPHPLFLVFGGEYLLDLEDFSFLKTSTESISSLGRHFWVYRVQNPKHSLLLLGNHWFVCCQSPL